jgi:arylsulfatase A-like enzyme
MPNPQRLSLAALAISTTFGLLATETLADDSSSAKAPTRPNVILIMTDDQGYGDLACHGNTILKTPAIDRLHAESVRLTNYHVDPTCSPTRSALLTGRYSTRTGVWHTIMGRSMMHTDEVTLAEVFSASSYRTGCFGKWHLGDNYPLRPQDQGFHEVLVHGGGGVGQTPDFFGNKYFDDTYWHNGQVVKQKGYCTDVFFDAAMKFIADTARPTVGKSQPFFCYIPTNAAHGPFLVADKYKKPYLDAGVPARRAAFYGMITNIDENVARLRKHLAASGLADNTLLIFTTDNGTAAGAGRDGGFNAGLRGTKGSEFDGGHRVPCFWHWPTGKLTGGRDVKRVTAHVDMLPTLSEICGLKPPTDRTIDGTSLLPLLNGKSGGWPARTLFVHSQRIEFPTKLRKCAVMTDRWRLVNGKQLFDLDADYGQETDVAGDHPDVVKRLSGAYDTWWTSIGTRFKDYVRIGLGHKSDNPTLLTCHDWHTNNGPVPWNQGHIRSGLKANGFWAVTVTRSGKYRITLRTRPPGMDHPLEAATAKLAIGKTTREQPVAADATSVSFTVELKAGDSRLQTTLTPKTGKPRGAYFVEIEAL